MIAPPIGVFIISMWGWREVFFAFAIPGIILSVVWYLSVKNTAGRERHGVAGRA